MDNKSPKNLKIKAGDHDVTKKDQGEQTAQVCKKYVHKGYGNQLNDVALLKLCKPVTLSKKIKPITMAQKTLKVPKSETLTVAGWGRTKEGGKKRTSVLRKVNVKKIEFADCKKKPGMQRINQGNICAGIAKGGKDSCQGDSGGPLTWTTRKYKNTYLVGVVSWGRGCARPGEPGVYAKVAHYRSWIDRIIGAKEEDLRNETIINNSSEDSDN